MDCSGIAFSDFQEERGNPCLSPFFFQSFHQAPSNMHPLVFFSDRNLGNLTLIQNCPHADIAGSLSIYQRDEINIFFFFQGFQKAIFFPWS